MDAEGYTRFFSLQALCSLYFCVRTAHLSQTSLCQRRSAPGNLSGFVLERQHGACTAVHVGMRPHYTGLLAAEPFAAPAPADAPGVRARGAQHSRACRAVLVVLLVLFRVPVAFLAIFMVTCNAFT